MEKKNIRTGIVGAGFSATFHYECLKKVHGTNVEVAGVFTRDPKHAEAYAGKRGIRAYGSLEEYGRHEELAKKSYKFNGDPNLEQYLKCRKNK